MIGKAIIERGALVTRLIERDDLLMQVTLPPGEALAKPPRPPSPRCRRRACG